MEGWAHYNGVQYSTVQHSTEQYRILYANQLCINLMNKSYIYTYGIFGNLPVNRVCVDEHLAASYVRDFASMRVVLARAVPPRLPVFSCSTLGTCYKISQID